jgi:septal ring factor EnvC (AmiA/AmiB activator)
LLVLGAALATPPVLAAPAAGESATTKSGSKSTPSRKAATPKKTAPRKKAAPRKKSSKTPAPSQRDLARLQAEIRSAEQRIKLTREQREQKEAELRQAELEIGSLKENMGTVQQDVSSREQRLRAVQAEKLQRENDRGRLVNQIRSDLQMAQRQGGEDYYKLLLNQENPQTLARLMKYYGYMQQARAGRVQALNETLARLEALEREEAENVGRLRSLRGELQQKQSRLSVAQQQRSQAIRTLSAQIESDDEKLQRLRRDEQSLQNVMERLAREAEAREKKAREQREAEKRRQQAGTPAPVVPRPVEPGKRPPVLVPAPVETEPRDFAAKPYKGRCPLPAAGGVRARFGSARAGGLRWNGIVVDAPAGAAVRAIRPGRVAFADYLRGYGFLIIVDHGRGLMSLYGQNRSLQKKAGEQVGANEVIASVGDSAGSDTGGLYFEIRVRGRPSDPAEWCAYQ